MTDEPNACDLAIARHRAAMQALADMADPKSPVSLSHAITGKPTLAELWKEADAASAEVDAACEGRGPSR